MAAVQKKIPALIQEQNGFAGLTNKMLGPRVQSICVAYDGLDRFFPPEKIIKTGNPIRKEFLIETLFTPDTVNAVQLIEGNCSADYELYEYLGNTGFYEKIKAILNPE